MENFTLVSLITNIKLNQEKAHLTVLKSDSLSIVHLDLEIMSAFAINEPLYLKLKYANEKPEKFPLYVTKQTNKLLITVQSADSKIKSLALNHSKHIVRVEITLSEKSIIKDFKSLPKKLFVVNLTSYMHPNSFFQLTGAELLYYPVINLMCVLNFKLLLSVSVNDISYNYKLKKQGNYYILENKDPVPIVLETTSDMLKLSVNIIDEDTHKTLWFSYPTTFQIFPTSFIQLQLQTMKKYIPGTNIPILYIENTYQGRNLKILDCPYKMSKLSLSVFKNDTFSIQYNTELDDPASSQQINLQTTFGERQIHAGLKYPDTFTIVCVKLLTENGLYSFVNKSLKTDLFTLQVMKKMTAKGTPSLKEK